MQKKLIYIVYVKCSHSYMPLCNRCYCSQTTSYNYLLLAIKPQIYLFGSATIIHIRSAAECVGLVWNIQVGTHTFKSMFTGVERVFLLYEAFTSASNCPRACTFMLSVLNMPTLTVLSKERTSTYILIYSAKHKLLVVNNLKNKVTYLNIHLVFVLSPILRNNLCNT